MFRVEPSPQRPDWMETIQRRGLPYWYNELPDGTKVPYWCEEAHYVLGSDEVGAFERRANRLIEMCVEAGDYVIHHDLWDRFRIPEFARQGIIKTWNDDANTPRLYGRFDFRYAGHGPQAAADPTLLVPKLLEFNADTPTTLVEAAITQWDWFQELLLGHDQWNGLDEALIRAWRDELKSVVRRLGRSPVIYFACTSDEHSGEDLMTVQYLRGTAEAAGFKAKTILMEDITWKTVDVPTASATSTWTHEERGGFYDPEGNHIDVIFKLYPWEWMCEQDFGPHVFTDMARPGPDGPTVWIEPPYKMLWSNKALLPVLWKIFAGNKALNQLLLPTYFEGEQPADLVSYVRKPLFGREGNNITIVQDGKTILETGGPYTDSPFVYQQFAPLPCYPDAFGKPRYPLSTVWMVAGEAMGFGIRETSGLVTDNYSRFVPHVITFDRTQPIDPNATI